MRTLRSYAALLRRRAAYDDGRFAGERFPYTCFFFSVSADDTSHCRRASIYYTCRFTSADGMPSSNTALRRRLPYAQTFAHATHSSARTFATISPGSSPFQASFLLRYFLCTDIKQKSTKYPAHFPPHARAAAPLTSCQSPIAKRQRNIKRVKSILCLLPLKLRYIQTLQDTARQRRPISRDNDSGQCRAADIERSFT